MNLYKIEYNGAQYFFNSSNDDLDVNGTIYKAIPIGRSEIIFDLEHSTCKITVPLQVRPFSLLVDSTPVKPFKVEIKSYPEDIVLYIGVLQKMNANFFKGTMDIDLVTEVSLQENVVPRRTYGRSCSWELGGSECGVDLGSYQETVNVDTLTINGVELTHPNFANYANGFFENGMAKHDLDEYIFIVKHVGDTITLMTRFQQLDQANTLTVFAGCDKQASTCRDKFNNICNFSGFPYMPSNNPALEDY